MSRPADPVSVSFPAPPSSRSAPAPPTTCRSRPRRGAGRYRDPGDPVVPAEPANRVAAEGPGEHVAVDRAGDRAAGAAKRRAPVGRHVPVRGLLRSLRCEPPVAVIWKNSRLSLAVRSLTNTIERPLGENDGSASSAGLFVSRRWLAPSAFIAQMSRFPASSRSESKTIVRPFGDRRVLATDVRGVRQLRLPAAVGVHIQTCRRPVRSLMNAILEPSGDQAGSASAAGEVVSRI